MKLMTLPDAVLKHDGRRVAFDLRRLEASIMRAGATARDSLPPDAACVLAEKAAARVVECALSENKNVLATYDIRAFALQSLRVLQFETVAEAYQEYARATALLLWRVRVADPELPQSEACGTPWDRRRLLESLRSSGVAFDVAGAVARNVERRLIGLGSEWVSPALIHALALLELPQKALGVRRYAVRRVAYSASEFLPPGNARSESLTSTGKPLEEFWLQGIHTPEVVQAVRDNLLALDPYPSVVDELHLDCASSPLDPLSAHFYSTLKARLCEGAGQLDICADTPKRILMIAEAFKTIADESAVSLSPPAKCLLIFKADTAQRAGRSVMTAPITVNAGGLAAREVLRDPARAVTRLVELLELAISAHRERGNYFLISSDYRRVFPIAVAGLWNATALLQGADFDAERASIGVRGVIEPLCRALRSIVDGWRTDGSKEVYLTANVPPAAERRLWDNDREFFLHDGRKLNAVSSYENGELKLSLASGDLVNRLDFARALGSAFDDGPAVAVEAPLSRETSVTQWRDLFEGVVQAGITSMRVNFSGSARTVPNLTRAIRSYVVGFPLLDGLSSS